MPHHTHLSLDKISGFLLDLEARGQSVTLLPGVGRFPLKVLKVLHHTPQVFNFADQVVDICPHVKLPGGAGGTADAEENVDRSRRVG